MNLITKVIFVVLALSVQAEDEVCEDVGVAFRMCVKNNVLTRVSKDSSTGSYFPNLRHVWLKFSGDTEVSDNAFSEVDLTTLWFTFGQSVSDDTSSSKTLKLHPDSFAHLSNLTELQVNYANVNFEGNPLTHVGLLKILKLTYGNLTEIPKELLVSLPNLEELDLEKNCIRHLPENVFAGNRRLKHIKLNSNRITTLEPGWANGLNDLERIDFFDTSISAQPGIFFGIQHIKELQIAKAFDSNGFQQHLIRHFPNLIFLGLGYNNLSTLTPGMLDGCPKLQEISFYGNQLRSVPTGVFEKLASLKEISLADNEIESIVPGAFSGLNMKYLGLTINKVKTIQPRTFSGLRVRRLGFNTNKISELKPYAFDGLTATAVDITYNQITKICSDDFSGLITDDLDLSGNDIRTIANGAFKNTTLNRLGFYNTPIKTVNKSQLGLSESVEILN